MMNIDPRINIIQPDRRVRAFPPSFVEAKFNSWQLGLPVELSGYTAADIPVIIAVGGGKGGVGKSVVSANVAASFGLVGRQVLVVDMDLSCANLHTHFGMGMPSISMADFIVKKQISIKDAMLPTGVPGVSIIAGGREEDWGGWLAGQQDMSGLWRVLPTLRKDYNIEFVIFDLGAGTGKYTMEFFAAAHVGVVTVLPEPTSIENAYVFIKTALWKLIDNLGTRLGQVDVAREVLHTLAINAPRAASSSYMESFRKLYTTHPAFIVQVVEMMRSRILGIVINQTREQTDIDIGKSMEHLSARFFGFNTQFLGYMNYDESVWKSLRNRRMLMKDFNHSLIAKNLGKVADEILFQLEHNGEKR